MNVVDGLLVGVGGALRFLWSAFLGVAASSRRLMVWMVGTRRLAVLLAATGIVFLVLAIARVLMPLERAPRNEVEARSQSFRRWTFTGGRGNVLDEALATLAEPGPWVPTLKDWEGTRLQSGILCLSGGFMLVGGILLGRRKE